MPSECAYTRGRVAYMEILRIYVSQINSITLAISAVLLYLEIPLGLNAINYGLKALYELTVGVGILSGELVKIDRALQLSINSYIFCRKANICLRDYNDDIRRYLYARPSSADGL